jgi:hypothetical protein
LRSAIRISSLVKNPKKGGTPAIEKREIATIVVKKKLNFKSEKEYKVLKLKLTNWVKTKKIK